MSKIFDTFQLHKVCLANNTEFVEAHITADLFITGAYWAFPFVFLFFLVFKHHLHRHLSLSWWLACVALAGFIFFCSLTHLMSIYVTIFDPDYRLELFIKQVTAWVSWLAVFAWAWAFWHDPLNNISNDN